MFCFGGGLHPLLNATCLVKKEVTYDKFFLMNLQIWSSASNYQLQINLSFTHIFKNIIAHYEWETLLCSNKNTASLQYDCGNIFQLAMLDLQNWMAQAQSSGHCCLGVYLELSEAFDTVNYDELRTTIFFFLQV